MEENNVNMNELEETNDNEVVESAEGSSGSGLAIAGVLVGALAIYGVCNLGCKVGKLAKKGYHWAKAKLGKEPDTTNVVEGEFEVVTEEEKTEEAEAK